LPLAARGPGNPEGGYRSYRLSFGKYLGAKRYRYIAWRQDIHRHTEQIFQLDLQLTKVK